MGKEKDLKKPQSKEVAVTMFSEDKVELDDEYNSAADFSRPEKTILKAIRSPPIGCNSRARLWSCP